MMMVAVGVAATVVVVMIMMICKRHLGTEFTEGGEYQKLEPGITLNVITSYIDFLPTSSTHNQTHLKYKKFLRILKICCTGTSCVFFISSSVTAPHLDWSYQR